jgi:hypothetical protein
VRPFAKPTPLSVLSLEARVLYSAFIAFLLVGVWTAAWLWHDDGLGVSPAAARAYYLGEAGAPLGDAPVAAPPADTGGPALDLPPEAARQGELRVAKSARQVIETFHFHMFSVPVCLLIVGHLFMMCRWSTRSKVMVLALASLATLAHLFGPVLVRFASGAFAALFVASALAMTALWTLMLLVPLVEMWRPSPARE